jgi:hypothetical protein
MRAAGCPAQSRNGAPAGGSPPEVQDEVEQGHLGQGGEAAEGETDGVLPVLIEELHLCAGEQQPGARALRIGIGRLQSPFVIGAVRTHPGARQ